MVIHAKHEIQLYFPIYVHKSQIMYHFKIHYFISMNQRNALQEFSFLND